MLSSRDMIIDALQPIGRHVVELPVNGKELELSMMDRSKSEDWWKVNRNNILLPST